MDPCPQLVAPEDEAESGEGGKVLGMGDPEPSNGLVNRELSFSSRQSQEAIGRGWQVLFEVSAFLHVSIRPTARNEADCIHLGGVSKCSDRIAVIEECKNAASRDRVDRGRNNDDLLRLVHYCRQRAAETLLEGLLQIDPEADGSR